MLKSRKRACFSAALSYQAQSKQRGQHFLANSSPPLLERIFGKGKCKLMANFSATMVTSLPSLSLALKLAMNLHFPLPKIRTIGDELTLSLAKNSHFSFLPSHFPSLPSRRGHHCGAEIRNEFTPSIAKKCFALFVLPLSNGTSRATSDRKPKTNDQILPSPMLFFPSKK